MMLNACGNPQVFFSEKYVFQAIRHIKNRRVKGDLKKYGGQGQKNKYVPFIKDERGEILEDVYFLDSLMPYDENYLQTTILSRTTEYFVLYRNTGTIDLSTACRWYVLDSPMV